MHLRSLTMKGFKSFADPTTIELEPGVTVVVGPNGSGKSNVVDAVAWVLGAQGPRVVRSAKMDDVIFVGTQKRAALGRAEVTLTIDNSDRRLPIEFSEVMIRRTLFRSGDSEYELNGVACRLLDIQELLSDSGVGRTQHVIISQGQLDTILSASPEERRAVIEEAAGVLKFRRRRERAVRRLDATEQGLVRVQDMLREVRRQLRPLERQAASSNRHAELTSELDRLRRFIAARELRNLRATQASLQDQALRLIEATTATTEALDLAEGRIAAAETQVAIDPPAELANPLSRLSQLLERAKGLSALAEERSHSRSALLAALDDATGLAGLRGSLSRTIADIEHLSSEEADGEAARRDLASAESELVASRGDDVDASELGEPSDVTRRAADARGLVEQKRVLVESRRGHLAQVAGRVALLEQRVEDLSTQLASTEVEVAELRASRDAADAAVAVAAASESEAAAARMAAERAVAAASEVRHGLSSRVDAFLDALAGIRAEAGVEQLFGMQGVLGTLLELVEVDEEIALAFEAAAEHALSAVVVAGISDARAAIAHLRAIGRSASLLVAPRSSSPTRRAVQGGELLRNAVRGTGADVDRLLDQLLDGVVLVRGGLDQALSVIEQSSDVTVVTLDGDRLGPGGWRIGAARSGATTAALDAARAQLASAIERQDAAEARLVEATSVERGFSAERVGKEDVLRPIPARLATSEQRLTELAAALRVIGNELAIARGEARAATAEVELIARELAAAEIALVEVAEEELAELSRSERSEQLRREFDERARELHERRRDVDVAAATLAERRTLLVAREIELRSELASREAAFAEATSRGTAFAEEIAVLERLQGMLANIAERLVAERSELSGEQLRRQQRLNANVAALTELRAEKDRVEREHALLAERRQRLEIDQTEARVRSEAAVEALRHELDLTPEELLAAPEPELPFGMDAAARRRQVERELRELGPVNLLAQEELEVLTERNTFLESQLEDIRSSRRELNQVIRAVDQEIVSVFTAAFADVALNFERLIETLFPGGSGGLTLTNADDLLETGVEIEARPAGRNVRRLSLLSGGERSLVAMAFLFAVFRSRPSPFYLMDEVEAALDDANLQRFLALVDDFRDEAQLIIVSHQKRTMEVADALYGISMQPGGASKVVSERLRATSSRASGVLAHVDASFGSMPADGDRVGPDTRPGVPT
ncbi:MAG TPA: chromosome segregation protein SMC [Acidimicrobiales bacterium]